jgi:UDP-N-acetyl-D-mannosaminuronic acid dehydrogenase
LKPSKVCILGLGYIGLPTASLLATHGVKVAGVDINPHIISTLQNGSLHIYEPGLDKLVQKAFQQGSLTVSQQAEPADAFIIAVPTPFYDDKRADLRAVTAASEAITSHLRQGNLVILESTSPPLTTVKVVAPILERSGLKAGQDFFLAYSPERVLPGQILKEIIDNPRVIGGINPASAEAGSELYRLFVRGEIVLTDATTAEIVKLMENTYRDINIAIANEFSRLAERFGVDIWEAAAIANRHPRVKILRPGPGVGGHCISVDPWFLVEAAPDLATLIRAARTVNDSQPQFVMELIHKAVGEPAGKRFAVLGLSFKPNVDDLRESPAIEVAHLLQQQGAQVQPYEPFRPDAEIPGLALVPSLEAALHGADVILLLVAHTQFCQLEPQAVAQMTPARLVFDAVGGLNRQAWRAAGFTFTGLGVKMPQLPDPC